LGNFLESRELMEFWKFLESGGLMEFEESGEFGESVLGI
jgi:hypothetical protein